MLSKKFILTLVVVFCVMSLSFAFAKEEVVATSGEAIVSGETIEEPVETPSGEEIASGEAVLEPSGDVVISGEEVVEPSGEEATSGEPAVSGEEVANPSGEEATSGEVAVSGETVEEVSGEAVTSGEPASESGEANIVANDVEDGRWYAPFVNEALNKGYMGLDEEGNFNPKNAVTKADVVEAIYNLPGDKTKAEKEWAIENGIIDEKDDLEVEAKREDIAVLVYKYAKANGGGFKGSWMFLLGVDDVDDISDDAYEAVAWCVMNDIIIGKTEDTVDVQDVATRAELATIMCRVAEAK